MINEFVTLIVSFELTLKVAEVAEINSVSEGLGLIMLTLGAANPIPTAKSNVKINNNSYFFILSSSFLFLLISISFSLYIVFILFSLPIVSFSAPIQPKIHMHKQQKTNTKQQ